MPGSVYILDSSALIWLKEQLPKSLHEVLGKLTELVEAEVATFPRQVREELDRYDDVLSQWAKQAWRSCTHYDVHPAIAAEVIPQIAEVVDAEKTRECADPWLLAQAVELRRYEPGRIPEVVSNDFRDRQSHRSVQWGCRKLEVAFTRPGDFLLILNDLVEACAAAPEPEMLQLFDDDSL